MRCESVDNALIYFQEVGMGGYGMLFIAIIVIIGIFRRQTFKYWRNSVLAVIFQIIWSVLFHQDYGILAPSLDSFGPVIVLLWAAIVILGAWGIPIYLVRAGYQKPPLKSPGSEEGLGPREVPSDLLFHFGVLGVGEQASIEEVRQAYRDLAKLLHPDVHNGNESAKKRFQKLQESYEFLIAYMNETRDIKSPDTQTNDDAIRKTTVPSVSGAYSGFPYLPAATILVGLVGVLTVLVYRKSDTLTETNNRRLNSQPVVDATTKPAGECSIKVESDPPGADVYLDNELRGITPATLTGYCNRALVLSLRLSGYEVLTESLVLRNPYNEYYRNLKRIPVGTLELMVDRNADVYINGQMIGTADANRMFERTLRANETYTVRLTSSTSGLQTQFKIDITEGKVSHREIRLEESGIRKPRARRNR
jgi:hypothetical protein